MTCNVVRLLLDISVQLLYFSICINLLESCRIVVLLLFSLSASSFSFTDTYRWSRDHDLPCWRSSQVGAGRGGPGIIGWIAVAPRGDRYSVRLSLSALVNGSVFGLVQPLTALKAVEAHLVGKWKNMYLN